MARSRMTRWIAAAGLAFLPGTAFLPAPRVAAQSTVVLSPAEVVDLRRVTDADLSPDGSRIAFVTSRWRREGESPGPAYSEIWLVASEGGEAKRFTSGEKGDSHPRFSPDGRLLAFLSTRGTSDKAQVHLIPLDGGEARALTASKTPVLSFAFSKDGKRVAYVAAEAPTEEEEKRKKAGDDAVRVDRDFKQRRLFVIDVMGGEPKPVSPPDLTVWSFDWAPPGDHFVIVASATPRVDDQYCFSRLHVVDPQSQKATLLHDPRGKLTTAKWSPDGETIAFLASGDGGAEPYAGSLFVIPADGGSPRHLAADLDGTCTNLAWSPRGDLLFTAIERQYTAIYSLDVKTGNRKSIARGVGALAPSGLLALSADGSRFATLRSAANHPPEVYLVQSSNGEMRRVTNLNPSLENVLFGGEEVVSWKGPGDLEIEGVLVKPVGYEPGRAYPLVVYVHGGPESAELLGFHCSWGGWSQPLAQRGFAVLRPNYRGSIGRGVAFARADQKDLGGGEWQDIFAGVDAMIERGIADADRLGIGGWSYGGYMTAWAVGQTDRFKAAVMGAGISNWVSMVGTSDITYENSIFHWASWAYDDFALHFGRSGLAHVKNVKTPVLILHGQNDPRVPLSQGQEFYNALRVLEKPVEMVTYPREPHGIGERLHQIDVLTRVIDWFERHVKGAAAAAPAATGSAR